jgi:hypothetical protein
MTAILALQGLDQPTVVAQAGRALLSSTISIVCCRQD